MLEKSKVLHRDVSLGNILILDERKDDDDEHGFMHDMDYSSMETLENGSAIQQDLSNDDEVDAMRLKERTVSDTHIYVRLQLLTSRIGDVLLHGLGTYRPEIRPAPLPPPRPRVVLLGAFMGGPATHRLFHPPQWR